MSQSFIQCIFHRVPLCLRHYSRHCRTTSEKNIQQSSQRGIYILVTYFPNHSKYLLNIYMLGNVVIILCMKSSMELRRVTPVGAVITIIIIIKDCTRECRNVKMGQMVSGRPRI